MVIGVTFYTVVLAIHIAAVVVAFGVTFAYPLIFPLAHKLDPRSLPTLYRIQGVIGKRLITPGLLVVLLAGIYLASKLHMWDVFYVQWGLGVAIVLGGLGGAFFAPREEKLAELAERDIAASGDGEIKLSDEFNALESQVARVGALASLLILVTVYFMVAHVGV
jgi:hypothetical protein